MTGDRWAAAEAEFQRLAPMSAAERSSALATLTARDPALAEEVRGLLAAHDGEGPLDRLAEGLAGATLAAGERDDLSGRTIGTYRIGKVAGRGGMGIVYDATDVRLRRRVALKFLPAWLGADPAAKERFFTEARVASSLDHPNVCTLLEIGETAAGDLFLVMPFYEGETLQARLRRGPLPPAEALAIARQTADGLAAAHRRGIVHRDIKPGNLLLAADGRVKILDFGIAKLADVQLTRTGERVGTVHYMSPEQATGDTVDARSDLFSLGVVLHEMLVGRRPRLSSPEPVAELPPRCRPLVGKLLQLEPADRPADAEAVRAAVAQLEAEPIEQLPSRRRFDRAPVVVAGMAAVLLLALLVFAALRSRGPAVAAAADTAWAGPAVAVLPFRLSGEGVELWREGIVDVLTHNLEGLDPLRPIGAQSVMRTWRRVAGEDDASHTVSQTLAAARELGVAYGITGTAVRLGSTVRLTAEVHDVATGRMLGTVQVDGTADSVLALTDNLTIELLRSGHLPVDDRRSAAALGRTGTTSLAALKEYLAGEQAFRRTRFTEAVEHFKRAVGLDSTFARAYMRLAAAAFWTSDLSLRDESHARASELSDRLSERDQLLLRGLMRRDLAPLDTFTWRYPDDVEGWSALGDRAFHFGGAALAPAAKFRGALERSVALSPYYGEYYVHLLEDAFLRLDSTRVDELLAGLDSVDASRTGCPGYYTVRDLAWGNPEARREAAAALDTTSDRGLNCAWVTVAASPVAAAHMERRDRSRMVTDGPPAGRFVGLWRSLQARVMRGELEAASVLLRIADSVPLLDTTVARHRVSFYLSGLGDSAEAARAVAQLRENPAPTPEDRFWIAAWAIAMGRAAEADAQARALAAEAARLDAPDRRVEARAIAQAIRLYGELASGRMDRLDELRRVSRDLPRANFSNEVPDQFLRYRVGTLLLERGAYDRAEAYFQSIYPYDWTWYVLSQFQLGRVYEALGRTEEARARYALGAAWWHGADPALQPWVQEARDYLRRSDGS